MDNILQFPETTLYSKLVPKTAFYRHLDLNRSPLIKNAIKDIDDHLKVTEIRIAVKSGGMDSIRNRETLEAGVAIQQIETRTIHVTEAIGSKISRIINDCKTLSVIQYIKILLIQTYSQNQH